MRANACVYVRFVRPSVCSKLNLRSCVRLCARLMLCVSVCCHRVSEKAANAPRERIIILALKPLPPPYFKSRRCSPLTAVVLLPLPLLLLLPLHSKVDLIASLVQSAALSLHHGSHRLCASLAVQWQRTDLNANSHNRTKQQQRAGTGGGSSSNSSRSKFQQQQKQQQQRALCECESCPRE